MNKIKALALTVAFAVLSTAAQATVHETFYGRGYIRQHAVDDLLANLQRQSFIEDCDFIGGYVWYGPINDAPPEIWPPRPVEFLYHVVSQNLTCIIDASED